MFRSLFKQPLFLSGSLFVVFLLIASLVHSIFFHGVIPTKQLYYQNGHLVAASPLNPLQAPPFGTNRLGQEVFFKVLSGAKYTIGIAVIVSTLRMIVSFFIGLFYRNFLVRFGKYVTGVTNAFYYLPSSLICYVLLQSVVVSYGFQPPKFEFSLETRVAFEFVIVTLVAVPTLSILIGNELDQAYKREFISVARTLGGGPIHILRKHVLSYLGPRLLIQWIQQIVMVLILDLHLGFFHILFGGTKQTLTGYYSVTGEWASLFGDNYGHLYNHSWIALAPLVAFAFLILSFNYIGKGMEEVLLDDTHRFKQKSKKSVIMTNHYKNGEPSFESVRNHEQ